MKLNLSLTTMGAALSAALALSGCGGGGDDGDSAATAANYFAAYAGTWTSDCADHAKDIATITSTGKTLSIATTTNYYDAVDCTGAVVATGTSSAPLSGVSTGTQSAIVVLPPATTASTIVVENIAATYPQRTQTITGTGVYTTTNSAGVAQVCVKYTNNLSTCIPSAAQTTASANAGVYVSGSNLYLLASVLGTYGVSEHFTKN